VELLKQFNNQKLIITVINPHYTEEQKNMGRDKFRNPAAYEDISTLVQRNQEDIIHDTVANKKYKCYSTKCRKSFFTVQLLIQHERIHVRYQFQHTLPNSLLIVVEKAVSMHGRWM